MLSQWWLDHPRLHVIQASAKGAKQLGSGISLVAKNDFNVWLTIVFLPCNTIAIHSKWSKLVHS